MDSHLGTGSLFTEAPDLSMPCRLMFDGSPLPMIAVAGARHIVCYVNPAFYGLTAKSDAELIGNPFAEIVIEEEFLLILGAVYSTGKAKTYTEAYIRAALIKSESIWHPSAIPW